MQSGKSASLFMFTSLIFFFILVLIYGIKIKNPVLIFNGILLFPMHIPVALWLLKFKKMLTIEKIGTSLFIIASIASLLVSKNSLGIIYTIISLMTAIPLLHQVYTLWKEKSPGVVEIKMLIAFMLSALTWLIYSVVIKEFPLIFAGFLFFIIRITSIILWLRYSRINKIKSPIKKEVL
jgi:uncharacterized protein with PQ loop repeat